ncbi:MAG: phenylalanine--tRNA ligase subunit beta [Spirochaetales bacterium]|nr:phenylalanine--tRNA ligase subunit beta [Spirochaetales bacterium]
MQLSWNWLADYVDLNNVKVEEAVHRLTLATCEVEEWQEYFAHFSVLRIGQVTKKEKHPDADRLSVCTVDLSSEERIIVCGAANVAPGQYVPVALPGVTLPGDLTIKEAKIRGVASAGMICSAAELGAGDFFGESDGILVLPEQAARFKGRPLQELYPLHDTILSIDNKSITHRPDLWGHAGFARELAVLLKRKWRFNPFEEKSLMAPDGGILIDRGPAHAYYGAVVEGIRVLPSPGFIAARLFLLGQRPINNVVDASNYVMFELAQPNHAFDLASLPSRAIKVETAEQAKKTELELLDDRTIQLPGHAILITADSEALALAGIMGGRGSAIGPQTQSLFLESATFPRESIRKTLQSCPLRTESAIRFEKGQDPEKALVAIYRLVKILRLTCPDLKLTGLNGDHHRPPPTVIHTQLSFINKRLGLNLKTAQVKALLGPAGFLLKASKDELWVTVPSFRAWYDVTIPEDLVEEVGRLNGYDKLSPAAPLTPALPLKQNPARILEREVKTFLLGRGFTETYNYSFTSPERNRRLAEEAVVLANPVHAEHNEMRLSLIPGLLEQLRLNQDQLKEVRLFELGRVYPYRKGALPEERTLISAAIMPEKSKGNPEEWLFALRQVLEDLAHQHRLHLRLEYGVAPFFHPRACLDLLCPSGRFGHAGLISPVDLKEFDLRRPVALFYLDLETMQQNRQGVLYQKVETHPDSHFEVTVTMPVAADTSAPMRLIQALGLEAIREITLLDIYRGSPLQEGEQAVSYRFVCRSKDQTLERTQLQSLLDTIVGELQKKGYPLRSSP